MTKKWRRVYAWVLTVAMVLSMANLPITIAKAASTQNLTVKSGATSVTIAKNEYGDDYIGDMFFNIPDALKTKSAISSNKVTSMTVKITIKSFTQGSGAKAQAFIFAQPDASVFDCRAGYRQSVNAYLFLCRYGLERWNNAGKSWRAFCQCSRGEYRVLFC